MGALSNVPFLGGYLEQDQINRSREQQGMQQAGQFMTLQKMQQDMQNAPEDRALKLRLGNAQVGQYEAQAAEHQANAAKKKEAAAIIQQLSMLPPDHPDRPMLIQKARMILDPTGALDPEKMNPSPFGKVNPNEYTPASIAKFSISKNYGDLVAMAKPSTHINMPAPISTIRVIDTDPKSPYFQKPVLKDGRTGRTLGLDSGLDVGAQGAAASAKAGGKETGESTAKAQIAQPQVEASADQAIKLVDKLLKHPGFKSTVGMTLTPGMRFVEGSKEAGFMKMLDQLKGGAFLEAYTTLKGGGQITEIEGKKATDAITRMDKSLSEKEFMEAANDYVNVIKLGVERAKQKGTPKNRMAPPAAVQPSAGGVMKFDAQGNPI